MFRFCNVNITYERIYNLTLSIGRISQQDDDSDRNTAVTITARLDDETIVPFKVLSFISIFVSSETTTVKEE